MLKPYMVFSIIASSIEGACLAFAHNLREAKKIAWKGCDWEITDEWIDLGVRYIRNGSYLYAQANQEKLLSDTPHCISAPTPCRDCNLWGYPINEQGYCEDCYDDIQPNPHKP